MALRTGPGVETVCPHYITLKIFPADSVRMEGLACPLHTLTHEKCWCFTRNKIPEVLAGGCSSVQICFLFTPLFEFQFSKQELASWNSTEFSINAFLSPTHIPLHFLTTNKCQGSQRKCGSEDIFLPR